MEAEAMRRPFSMPLFDDLIVYAIIASVVAECLWLFGYPLNALTLILIQLGLLWSAAFGLLNAITIDKSNPKAEQINLVNWILFPWRKVILQGLTTAFMLATEVVPVVNFVGAIVGGAIMYVNLVLF